MKSIVLAEKPSVAKDLARVLGCGHKTKGYYEGNKYIVTWALGHLVTLADPGDIDNRFKEWKLDYLPMLPEKIRLKVIKKTSHQFNTISGLLKREDSREVIIATDAGREGELVARWILLLCGWKKEVQRLWISSQTDQAIQEGFKNLRPGKSYLPLYHAAVCRAEADWLIGLNVTRALSCKFEAQLTAGRVQTPTLAMIIAREEEIKRFNSVAYWHLDAEFKDFTARWQNKDGNSRLFERNTAETLAKKIEGKEGEVVKVKVQDKKEFPPAAYDLTELQREANRRFGFSAKKTLSIMQRLYEHYKVVTYPRTDSRYITEDIVKTLPARLKAINQAPYDHVVKPLLGTEPKPGAHFVNNNKVSDHHAIIPTEQPANLSQMDGDERRIYDLVVKRFLAVLYPPCLYTLITLQVDVEGELFTAKGKKIKDLGYRKIGQAEMPDEDAEEEDFAQSLPLCQQGEKRTVEKAKLKENKTKPPARYTEASLLSAMENAGQFVTGKELKESIKKGGLGTPATRADIIEKIINSYYVERENRFLIPTAKGYELIRLVPEALKSAELTARWELRLENIASSREQSKSFMTDIRKNTGELVAEVKGSSGQYKPSNLTDVPCPFCGEPMFTSKEKGQKLLVCPNRSCGHKQRPDANPYDQPDHRGKGKRGPKMNRGLIKKYSADQEEGGSTFADLIKAAQERKNRDK